MHFYFPYLFWMYEEGGGQMTCYWYVLILLKFLSAVCFLRGNNLLYSAYFKVHFQYQTKVGLDTKLSEFCLKSLLKYLPTDWPEWHEIVMWDIWFYT